MPPNFFPLAHFSILLPVTSVLENDVTADPNATFLPVTVPRREGFSASASNNMHRGNWM
jgi:hypothetical protein